MKRLLLTGIAVLFLGSLMGCANIQDVERERMTGNVIKHNYPYDWETVYNAMNYVIRHSEIDAVRLRYLSSHVDLSKDEKTITIIYTYVASVDMIIFFIPKDDGVDVEFAKGGYVGAGWRTSAIKTIIEETDYYLKHGKGEYKEYTHLSHIKAMKKFDHEN